MSWRGKAEDMGHVEEIGPSGKHGFGLKLKAHLRRFWWLYLILFVACTLILVFCLLYVAFPHISQHNINDSTLTIQSLVLLNPTPDSFHLVQTSVVGNGSPYHPNMDAFNASLSLDGAAPYAYVEIPQIHATAQATTVVDQDVKITDLDAFNAYNVAVLQNENVKLKVKGRTALHEMGFPTATVNYDKSVTMKGLNKLTGFNVTNFSIELTPEADGTNMIGTVYIPNPTVMTISMGNVTFNNYIANTPTFIGTTTLTNLTLHPGNNTLPMRSQINQSLVITQLLSTFKDGMLPIDIVGNSSIYNGQHLPYVEEAFKSVTQHITLNAGAALKAVGFDLSKAGGSPP
ncbi:hypothetical protein N7G274_001349 [Stereocaulon virgatum]|uniref:Late embryogenesis abundant protein LEA-2 subgroup domain-containing protein n=1 Tax=Stereocaulon virgatum TaxID=373712 RepID=A0ABR4AQC7_9LECA